MESEDKYCKVKIGEFDIPLIGIPKTYGLQECFLCHDEFRIDDIKISFEGKCYCLKCSEE